MPTYATAVQLRAHLDGTEYASLVPADDADADALVVLAERDLDAVAWPLLPRRAGAAKLEVGDLDPEQLDALTAATCEQVMYRLEMGPEHFVRAQRQRVQSRGASHEGRLPIVGPGAQRELTGGGLWRLTAQTGREGRDPDRWQAE